MKVSQIIHRYDLRTAYMLRDCHPLRANLPGLAKEGAGEQERWMAAKKAFAGTDAVIFSEWGLLDFSPRSFASLVYRGNLSYDAYLDIMKDSARHVKKEFELCYYNARTVFFKGEITSINRKNGTLRFERVDITAICSDRGKIIGKEEHVWMKINGFEKFKVGECVSFGAELYRYIKTNNGKRLDFGLRKPTGIKRIAAYKVPSDYDFELQEADRVICRACKHRDQCCDTCLNATWRESMRRIIASINTVAKSTKPFIISSPTENRTGFSHQE